LSAALHYFTSFYLICIITLQGAKFKPSMKNAHTFLYEYNEENSKEILIEGIDLGCQAFIVSADAFNLFLDDFHYAHDRAMQAFHNKHVVIYNERDGDLEEKIGDALRNPAIDGEQKKIVLK
jgi:hypothetical protein